NGAEGGSSPVCVERVRIKRAAPGSMRKCDASVKTPLIRAWWVMSMFWMFALIGPPRKTSAGRTSRRAISSTLPAFGGLVAALTKIRPLRAVVAVVPDRLIVADAAAVVEAAKSAVDATGAPPIGPSETAQLCAAR